MSPIERRLQKLERHVDEVSIVRLKLSQAEREQRIAGIFLEGGDNAAKLSRALGITWSRERGWERLAP